MHQSLDIQIVLFDVACHLQLFCHWIHAGQLAEHVGALITPRDAVGESDRNLSEKCINISLTVQSIDTHELVLVCEFREEVPLE